MKSNPLKGKVIAVDGPAGAGKGTLAKFISREYRVKYLDTGTLYRTIALRVIENGGNPAVEADALAATDLSKYDFKHIGNNEFRAFWDGEDITSKLRAPEVGNATSKVAFFSSVREKLNGFQKEYAEKWGKKYGVLMDGRDIGTVICPNADLKIYLDAKAEERAKRRQEELTDRGFDVTYEEVLSQVLERDARDMGRQNAPLKAANDALIIDSTQLSIDEVLKLCQNHIEQRLTNA